MSLARLFANHVMCPDCGAITHAEIQPDGLDLYVCDAACGFSAQGVPLTNRREWRQP